MTSIDFLANGGDFGGGEVMLLRMAGVARDLGFKVRVVGPTNPSALHRAAIESGFPFIPVTGRSRGGYMAGLAAFSLRRTDEVLWCNGLVPALATVGSRAARVIHLHQIPAARQRHILPLALSRAEGIIVPSHAMASNMGIPDSSVLHNWTEWMDPVSRPVASAPSPVAVGFIGRLSPIKGIDVLAEAVGLLNAREPSRYRLVVAGDDRLVPQARAAGVQHALDHLGSAVTQLGWVEPSCFYRQVDVVVVPSRWEEPFGLVAAESLAAGVPLIVSTAGALPEIVGDYPWTVPAGDARALADMIATVFADPERRQSVASAGRARWLSRFAPEAGRQRFEKKLVELGFFASQGGA